MIITNHLGNLDNEAKTISKTGVQTLAHIVMMRIQALPHEELAKLKRKLQGYNVPKKKWNQS